MGQIVTMVVLVFVLGAILLLERRCLGKTALVQPLVLCLLGGVLCGEENIALWIGISLQLLSIGQSHYCNWVFASIVSTGTVVVLGQYDVHMAPGSIGSVVLLLASILFGIISDSAARKYARGTPQLLKEADIWRSEEGLEAFAKLIYRRVARGFVFGGAQSIVGVGVASMLVFVISETIYLEPHPRLPAIISLAVPLFGVAVTLGSLSGRRYPFYAGIGVVISMGLWAIL